MDEALTALDLAIHSGPAWNERGFLTALLFTLYKRPDTHPDGELSVTQLRQGRKPVRPIFNNKLLESSKGDYWCGVGSSPF
jgi:hypothetical protein